MSIKLDDVADVRVNGTVDALDVTLDGVRLNRPPGAAKPAGSDRETLREIGRQVRDRLLR
jgi:hypothetical protein